MARPGRQRAQHRLGPRLLRGDRAALRAGGYINFASPDDQPKAPDNYGANYRRLTEVKRRYDPGNLFHLNQNIRPLPAGAAGRHA